jgi:hypothetical protein
MRYYVEFLVPTGAHDQLRYINCAVRLSREALAQTPVDHADRASRLYHLGLGCHTYFGINYQREHLDQAIQLFREALSIILLGDQYHAARLYQLGTGFRDRYERDRLMTDLHQSIQIFKEALDTTPQDHSERAIQLQSPGI